MRARALSRRGFLRLSTTSAGGLLLCGTLPACRSREASASTTFRPNPYLQVDPDGSVHIWAPRPDVGEGTRTSLPMLVAEELEVDWARIQIHQADLDTAAYGDQDVGGSDSVYSAWTRLRQAGAVGRELLKRAAAAEWSVASEECVAKGGVISHPATGRRVTYGAVAGAAARLKVPVAPPQLKRAGEYSLIGRRVTGIDNPAIVSGRPLFGLDVHQPDMLFAVVARCPVAGARLIEFDDKMARATPGVKAIVRIDGLQRATWLRTGVAVLADSTWAAIKGRDALRVRWDEGNAAQFDTERVTRELEELVARPGAVRRRAGDVDRALGRAAHTVDVVYQLPLLAHVSMEPMNCTAHVQAGRCEVWGPIQTPAGCRTNVARAIGLPEAAIAVHPTRTGGSFGRRLVSDFAAEAAVLAKIAGVPVQVVWTREDDLQHDFYRPAAVHRVRAGLDRDGTITAWRHHVACMANSMYPEVTGVSGLPAPRGDNLRADVSDGFVPCLIPNFHLESVVAHLPIETGSLRAPDDNANAFVVESVIDELAHVGRVDALDLRLRLLGTVADFPSPASQSAASAGLYNPDRLKGVLLRAAQAGGWREPSSPGRGRGLAGHYTNGGYAAHLVDLDAGPDRLLRIRRIVVAIDCGRPINRAGLEAQAQGGTIDALGAALFGDITLARGRSQQLSFDTYRLIRNREVPPVEVLVIESDVAPTGLGEIPYPPLAPALCNALFAATGVRLRRLPVLSQGFSI